jgi:hypothetical protein
MYESIDKPLRICVEASKVISSVAGESEADAFGNGGCRCDSRLRAAQHADADQLMFPARAFNLSSDG